MYTVYSKTSDSGHSEMETQYIKPVNKGHFSRSQIIICFPIVLIQSVHEECQSQTVYTSTMHTLNQTVKCAGHTCIHVLICM